MQLDDGWVATQAARLPEKYLQTIEAQGHGLKPLDPISAQDRAKETLMMGLRFKEGIAANMTVLDEGAVQDMAALGLLEHSGNRLSLTRAGWPLLNAVLEKILA